MKFFFLHKGPTWIANDTSSSSSCYDASRDLPDPLLP